MNQKTIYTRQCLYSMPVKMASFSSKVIIALCKLSIKEIFSIFNLTLWSISFKIPLKTLGVTQSIISYIITQIYSGKISNPFFVKLFGLCQLLQPLLWNWFLIKNLEIILVTSRLNSFKKS